MDRNLAFSALLVYGLAVLLPTVHLVFVDQGWGPAFLERIVVGVVSILAGQWLWRALRGPPKPATVPTFWGVNPVPLILGLLALYLAWFTNVPQALAGQASGSIFAATRLEGLESLAPRLATSAMTMLGVLLIQRGVRTNKTPEQRKFVRAEKRARRRAQRESNSQSGV